VLLRIEVLFHSTTDNRQQTTDNRQQTTDNRQQTTDNRQQTPPILSSLLAANSDSYAWSTPVDAGRMNLPDLAWSDLIMPYAENGDNPGQLSTIISIGAI
jgi:hypothetical protein